MESQWLALLAAEAKRSRQINAEIRGYANHFSYELYDAYWGFYRIKDRLQKRFANLADGLETKLRQFSKDLSEIEGELEVYLCSHIIQ